MHPIHNDERAIERAETLKDAEAAFEAAIRKLGFRYFDYASMWFDRLSDVKASVRFTANNYFSGDYLSYFPTDFPNGDPAVAALMARTVPFDYLEVLRAPPASATSLLQLAILKAYNVRYAWIVPLSTPTAMQFVSSYMQGAQTPEEFRATRAPIQLLSAALMDRAVAWHKAAGTFEEPNETPVVLTKEETACLKLVARGCTNPMIAEQLAISANTVRYHLKKVFAKLGVSTRAEAAARAAELKLD